MSARSRAFGAALAEEPLGPGRILAMVMCLCTATLHLPKVVAAWIAPSTAHSTLATLEVPHPHEAALGCVLSLPSQGRSPNVLIHWHVPPEWSEALEGQEVGVEVTRSEPGQADPIPGLLPEHVPVTAVSSDNPRHHSTFILGPDLPEFRKSSMVIGIRLTAGEHWVGPWLTATLSMKSKPKNAVCSLERA